LVLFVQACVLQSRDAYWLPTLFSGFPYTSPPVRHRVPSHIKRTLLATDPKQTAVHGLHRTAALAHVPLADRQYQTSQAQ
jgi:hypothetical protein